MEKHLLMIVTIVFLVGFVGFLTVMPRSADVTAPEQSDQATDNTGNGLTGNVVLAKTPSECSACTGGPVCAAKGTTAYDYPSACAARCDNAHILYDDYCATIPRAQRR
jgi:hypothetical protein